MCITFEGAESKNPTACPVRKATELSTNRLFLPSSNLWAYPEETWSRSNFRWMNLKPFDWQIMKDLSHEEAAKQLEISRSTFTRLIRKARKKVADFMFLGKMLTIGGGNVHFKNNIIRCLDCDHTFRVDINTRVGKCPECHSKNLLNAAGGFGHGNCCWEKTEDK